MPILTNFRHRFFNNDGTLLAGGKVYIYEAGSTTPKSSFTDSSGVTANANPVILDSKGEADIWTSGRFKVNITDANDVQITGYPVDGLGASQASYDIAGFNQSAGTNGATLLLLKMVRAVNFDVNLSGSSAESSAAAQSPIVLSVRKNGTEFGTINFAQGASSGTFSAPIPPAFAVGDILSIIASSTQVNFGNVGIILAGQILP